MAIAMYAYDGEHYVTALSLDNDLGEGVELAPEFYIINSPRISAKIVWHSQLKLYELTSAMLLANAMSRAYIGQSRAIDSSRAHTLKQLCYSRGRQMCELDEDEVESIYAKTYNFLDQLFTHSTVATVTRSIADNLVRNRHLSGTEISDLLNRLRR